jgi:hypothetical protein
VVSEIYRVLKPGGRCIIMVYAENSLHYWRNLFRDIGLRKSDLQNASMGEIMSRSVEISESGAKPLVKVYTAKRLRNMFADFEDIRICKRQLMQEELPRRLRWMPLDLAGRLMGWNLIIKARKPMGARGRRNGARNGAAAQQGGEKASGDTASHRSSAGPVANVAGLRRELDAAGLIFSAWLTARRSGRRQYVEDAIPHLDAVRTCDPWAADATVAAAESFLVHRFDLLGSGPFTPVDPDRPARDGYQPIDWYLDPVRQLRFPRGVPHKEWKLYEMRPGDADVKYPWELARSQHWITLAQAWRLTRDERFAIEIARQLDDFMEANPVGVGVNWTCTMDVAIRAANWCLALSFVLDSKELDDAFWERAYAALFDHAEFIIGNLENTYEVTSNHYLSNVVGLHVLAAEFADLKAGQAWNQWCREALETEIGVQVHPEGTDFESAVPYHRLVTELFMASARLARFQGAPLSAAYEAKLALMVEFVMAVTRPDGLMPVIGDADDGRFHIFSHLGGWNRQDARHLVAPAAMLLNRPEWLPFAGPAGAWEAAWWGFGPETIAPARSEPPSPIAKLFPELGVAVTRQDGHYLAVTNGAVGTRGFGNHKHNELLGFEYHCAGAPVIIDPGSYVYTSDFEARNLFRSTAYHSTLMIDGVEQNEFNPEWLFRMFEKAVPEHLAFAEDGEWVEYRGRHRGYERLPKPVTHERTFRFNRASGLLLIEDQLSGSGRHDLAWRFHLAPGVNIASYADGFALSVKSQPLRLVVPHDLAGGIEDSWYSPSYGVRLPSHRLALRAHVEVDPSRIWRFAIGPTLAVEKWQARSRSSLETAESVSA